MSDTFDITLTEGGAIKGKNATIKSIEPIEGGNRVTFEWEENDGRVLTHSMDVMDGEKGDTGETPNLTATASVGNTVGTPSVSVSRSGSNENPKLNFAFNNLKGDTGATPNISASATVNQTVGNPTVSVERSGSNENPSLAFNFSGLKGEKGEAEYINFDIDENGHLIEYGGGSDDITFNMQNGRMEVIYN